MREPERIETPLPGESSEGAGLVNALKTVVSQCRGRGFESLHFHQRPRSQGLKWDPPKGHKAPLSATWFVVELEDGS